MIEEVQENQPKSPRDEALALLRQALWKLEEAPRCREVSLAITKTEEAILWTEQSFKKA